MQLHGEEADPGEEAEWAMSVQQCLSHPRDGEYRPGQTWTPWL